MLESPVSPSSIESPPSPGAHVMDEKYFFPDGNCVFLVEGTLFKLHRDLLARDPESFFRSLFGDATGSLTEAIPLSQVNAADFRILCWSVYLFPAETYNLRYEKIGNPEIARYLALLDTANKFTMPQFESWAWQMLSAPAGKHKPLQAYLDSATEAILDLTMGRAFRSQKTALLERVKSTWIRRITNRELTFRAALDAGSKYSDRDFQADIYVTLWTRVRSDSLLGLSPTSGLSTLQLSEEESYKFATGFTILSNVFHLLSDAELTLPRSPRCNIVHWGGTCGCPTAWTTSTHGGEHRCIGDYLKKVNFSADIADYFMIPM
ncbi:hypothetical protein MKEN_00951800 [Mycena kentingensis (nom. inval.)]|nr:hypothetical protein MKEN_00951800 [Mycena kentingensis (nom. inval.)]